MECLGKDQFNILSPGWRDGILLKMFKMQQQGILCDTRLVSKDGDVINVHSPVLSAACPVFENIIENLGQDFEITFHDLSKHVLGMMVEFLYLGSTKAAWTEMCLLFEAAQGLSLTELIDACAQGMNSTEVVKVKKTTSCHVSRIKDIQSINIDPRTPSSDVMNMCDTETWSPTPQGGVSGLLSSTDDHQGLCKYIRQKEKDDDPRESPSTRIFKLEKNELDLHIAVKMESEREEESTGSNLNLNQNVEENSEYQETVLEPFISSSVENNVGDELTVFSECSDNAQPTTVTPFDTETENSPTGLVNITEEEKETRLNTELKKSPKQEQKPENFAPLQSLSKPNAEHKTGLPVVSCPVCKKTYQNNNSLQSHKCLGLDGQAVTKAFPCPTCGKTFSAKCNMQEHERIHTGEKPFVCDICGRPFRQRSNFISHKKLHSGFKPFACDNCQKTFVTKRSLITHKRYHSGERPFACDKCPKTFLEKTHLNKHKWLHRSDRPYMCAVCGKGFIQRVHCRNHMLYSHTGERPFRCKACSKGFHSKAYMDKHKCISLESHSPDDKTVTNIDPNGLLMMGLTSDNAPVSNLIDNMTVS